MITEIRVISAHQGGHTSRAIHKYPHGASAAQMQQWERNVNDTLRRLEVYGAELHGTSKLKYRMIEFERSQP